jgi:hypothetical protein
LGDVLDREKVKTSLQSTFANNFKDRLGDIYNPCRVFGMDDESGTLIATWPDGAAKPAVPVPYAQETMHGMEYAFGQMLMSYGMLEEGIKVTAGVRDRYDGERRNPWNEIECGSNYARSMASWGAMVVLAGFSFDATRGHIGFAPKVQEKGRFHSFWSGANAYGTVELGDGRLRLSLLGGELDLRSLGLPGGSGAVGAAKLNGKAVVIQSGRDEAIFDRLRLGAGDSIDVDVPGLGLMALPELARL